MTPSDLERLLELERQRDSEIGFVYVGGDEAAKEYQQLKDKIKKTLENTEKLREELQSLKVTRISGSGTYTDSKLTGLEEYHDPEFEMFQFDESDKDPKNWNICWAAVTMQELWSHPTIQSILKEKLEVKDIA